MQVLNEESQLLLDNIEEPHYSLIIWLLRFILFIAMFGLFVSLCYVIINDRIIHRCEIPWTGNTKI